MRQHPRRPLHDLSNLIHLCAFSPASRRSDSQPRLIPQQAPQSASLLHANNQQA